METTSPCRGCIYCSIVGGMASCDYIFKVGKRRPCPPGDACTVKTTAQRIPKKEKSNLRGTVRACQWCGTEFELSGNVTRIYCNYRCKDAAYRAKLKKMVGITK